MSEITSALDDLFFREASDPPILTFHVLPGDDAQHAHNILTDQVSRTKTSKTNTEELYDVAEGGGFTVKDHVGDGPRGGYMVGINRSSNRSFSDTSFSVKDIEEYQREHSSEISQSNAYFGAWHDPRSHKIYLDVSKNFTNCEDALAAAKQANELAIFDLGSSSSIYVSHRPTRGIIYI